LGNAPVVDRSSPVHVRVGRRRVLDHVWPPTLVGA